MAPCAMNLHRDIKSFALNQLTEPVQLDDRELSFAEWLHEGLGEVEPEMSPDTRMRAAIKVTKRLPANWVLL